jgi:outer membrane receptor protein involved in Fe transport
MSKVSTRAMRAIGLSCSASTLALAAPAMAQESAQPDLPQDAAPVSDAAPAIDAEASSAPAIVVTGSRLRTDGTQAPIPVTVVGAEALDAMGASGLVEAVSTLPQFLGNQSVSAVQVSGVGGTGWFARGGYGNLNLRGLGINRTLTLLNGHRVVSSSPFGGVDINTFPEEAISSVETVTGGASAAYGSDAVAGVVNFMLDRNFTGLRASAQAGITERGDNETYQFSALYGTKLGDRGHIIVSGEYSKQDGVHNYAGRDWHRAWGTVNGEAHPNVISANSSWDGVIFAPGTPLQGMEFLPDGSGIAPFVRSGISMGMTGTPPARHSVTDGGSGDPIGTDPFTIFPDAERNSVYVYGDYELTPNLLVYGQYMRGQNKTFRYNDPTGSLNGTPTAATIFADNAFLPQSVRNTMQANNIDSFVLRRMGSMEDLAPYAYLRDDSVMNSFAGGLTWDIQSSGFMEGWQADLYYQYGENTRKGYQNGLRVDRIFAALDAVDEGQATTGTPNGNIVCRATLFSEAFAGCEPINLFGRGNASAGAIDFVTGYEPGTTITTPIFYADTGFERGDTFTFTTGIEKVNRTKISQHVAEFDLNGDLLEGWAGPIVAAFGGSFRRESILQLVEDESNPSSDHASGHPVACNGEIPGLRGVSRADCLNTVGLQYSKVSNIIGSIDVYEAFAETLVPLINDAGPIDAANLHLAGRWANYTGSGTVWAYKAGLDVDMFDFLKLRGTYSRDVRAANLSERFDKTGGAAVVDDPRTPQQEAINVTIFSGGNPAVDPEKADTWTVGAVMRPALLPGLSLSLDYYDIKVKGAIGQLGSQAVLNGCLIDNVPELCELVTLVNDTPVLIGDIFINVNQNRVRGLDLEANYSAPLTLFGGDEEISARLFGSWLYENSETLSNGTYLDRAGQTGIQQSNGIPYGLADFRGTGTLTYSNGGFSTFLQGRYIAAGTQENALGDVPLNEVDSAFYLDLRLTYGFELGSGTEIETFAAVTNLTDQDPPVTPYYSVFGARSIQANSVLFDSLGRRFTVGVKLKM